VNAERLFCERVVGRLDDDRAAAEAVEVAWHQTVRRALRLVSDRGRPVDILLPHGHPPLAHGDILHDRGPEPVVVRVPAITLLRLRPPGNREALELGLALGNAHLPVEMCGGDVLTPDDGPTREIADRLGVPWTACHRPFHPRPASMLPVPITLHTGR
jgi:urease accessory protein UreE